MKYFFNKLKKILPNKFEFKLRSLKIRVVDTDTAEFANFVRLLGDNQSIAVDVGANAGLYSGVLSKYFRNVISVEPNVQCVEYMQSVLPSNCIIRQYAASDRAGNTELRIPIYDGMIESTRATISKDNTFEATQPEGFSVLQVPVQTVDHIVEEVGLDLSIRFIKIDTEGHEFEALSGALKTISRHKPSLCIEIEMEHGPISVEIYETLHNLDYVKVVCSRGSIEQDNRFANKKFNEIIEHDKQANKYFIHKTRIENIESIFVSM